MSIYSAARGRRLLVRELARVSLHFTISEVISKVENVRFEYAIIFEAVDFVIKEDIKNLVIDFCREVHLRNIYK